MEPTYMTSLKINKVRHLQDIEIPLSGTERKHLILTGKNGSGKTSVLTALADFLDRVACNDIPSEEKCRHFVEHWTNRVNSYPETEEGKRERNDAKNNLLFYKEKLNIWQSGVTGIFPSMYDVFDKYTNGQFILAFFSDNRKFDVAVSKNIEKVELPSVYPIKTDAGKNFAKYLVNLKTKQAFAQTQGKLETSQEIQAWFENFEQILRDIYEEPSLKLDFDIDTFQFNILIEGREPFDFNTMSMGYSAVFDIICDLMLRMEGKSYGLEGIVLIDEIETHLHVDLQKKIMPILTGLFPGLQFVLTTHSPFILNSLKNAVVYDLEKHLLVENGLTNLPYEGIVEGYFNTDTLSTELKEKFERYKQLAEKADPSDEDYAEMTELEMYLDEVPDYLALDFATEYARLKLEVNS